MKMRAQFEAIARRGSCVRTFDYHVVTIDLGLWQFRRGTHRLVLLLSR